MNMSLASTVRMWMMIPIVGNAALMTAKSTNASSRTANFSEKEMLWFLIGALIAPPTNKNGPE
jgi:hypothetical protein